MGVAFAFCPARMMQSTGAKQAQLQNAPRSCEKPDDQSSSATELQGRDNFVGLLPGSAVGPLEKGDVLLDILERPQVRRIDALLVHRTIYRWMRGVVRLAGSCLESVCTGILSNALSGDRCRWKRGAGTSAGSGATFIPTRASAHEDADC